MSTADHHQLISSYHAIYHSIYHSIDYPIYHPIYHSIYHPPIISSDVKLRRRVMAAFGEVIFYITAQADHADTVILPYSHS
jgi:hypothetical protein